MRLKGPAVVVAIIAVVILVAILTGCKRSSESKPSQRIMERGDVLYVSADPMGDIKTYSLTVSSDDGHDSLIVKCTSAYDVHVLVHFTQQVYDGSVRVKFDDGRPTSQTWRMENANHHEVFSSEAYDVLDRLVAANRFMIEYDEFGFGKVSRDVTEFATSGLHRGIPQLRTACQLP